MFRGFVSPVEFDFLNQREKKLSCCHFSRKNACDNQKNQSFFRQKNSRQKWAVGKTTTKIKMTAMKNIRLPFGNFSRVFPKIRNVSSVSKEAQLMSTWPLEVLSVPNVRECCEFVFCLLFVFALEVSNFLYQSGKNWLQGVKNWFLNIFVALNEMISFRYWHFYYEK